MPSCPHSDGTGCLIISPDQPGSLVYHLLQSSNIYIHYHFLRMLSSLKLWKEDLFDLGPIYRSSDRTMRDRFGKAHEEISQQCSWVRDHDYQSRYQRVLSSTTMCRLLTGDPRFHCGAIRRTSNEKSHVAQIDRAWISITRRRDSKEVIQKQRHGMRATEINH